MGVERVIVSSRSMSDCVYSYVYMDNLGCTECAILLLNIQKKSRDMTMCPAVQQKTRFYFQHV